MPKIIECYPASIRRKELLLLKNYSIQLSKNYLMIVLSENCFCAFWHLPKRNVKIIAEKQIVEGFSTQYAAMDL